MVRTLESNALLTFGRSPHFLLTSLLIFNSAGPVVIAHAGDDSIYGMKIVVNELDPRRNIFDLRIQETYTGPGQVERFTEPKIHFRITDQIPKTHASGQPRPVEPIPDTGLVNKISDRTEMLGTGRIKKYLGNYYFIYRPGRYDLFATDQIIIPRDLVEGIPDSAKRTRLLANPDESGKYCTDDVATSPTVSFTVSPWTEEWFNPEPEPDDLLQIKMTADVKDRHKLVIDEVIKPRPAFRTAVDMDPKKAAQWESGVFAGQGGRLVELKGKVNTDKLLRLESTDDYNQLLTDSWTICLIYHNGKLLEQPKRLPMPDAQAVELMKPISKDPIRDKDGFPSTTTPESKRAWEWYRWTRDRLAKQPTFKLATSKQFTSILPEVWKTLPKGEYEIRVGRRFFYPDLPPSAIKMATVSDKDKARRAQDWVIVDDLRYYAGPVIYSNKIKLTR